MSHPDQAQYPRLQGDDLYTWAQLISEAEQSRVALRRFGQQIAQKYNLPEDQLVISRQGYLILEEVSPPPNGRPSSSDADEATVMTGVNEP